MSLSQTQLQKISRGSMQLSAEDQQALECGVERHVYATLRDSIYPGAKHQSIAMVINYCKARSLDPLMKPVHIIPMNVKTSNGYEWRDVVMPGVGSYRINAARSGQYAGISDPEFGEDVTEKLGQSTITYPKWCKVTVKKIMDGRIFKFSAKEYWKENYATKGKNEQAPNAMWEKRPYGQLAKCAEAQALRKAFPDILGSEPTHEEMEGKIFKEDEQRKPTVTTIVNTVPVLTQDTITDNQDLELEFNDLIFALESCETMDSLQKLFMDIKGKNFKVRPDLFKKLIDAKDAKKSELTTRQFLDEYESTENINTETGEINNDDSV